MFSDPANYYGNSESDEESNHYIPSNNDWYKPPKGKTKYRVKIPNSFYCIISLIFLCFPVMFVTISFEHLMENKNRSYLEAQERHKKHRKKWGNHTNFLNNSTNGTDNGNHSYVNQFKVKAFSNKIASSNIVPDNNKFNNDNGIPLNQQEQQIDLSSINEPPVKNILSNPQEQPITPQNNEFNNENNYIPTVNQEEQQIIRQEEESLSSLTKHTWEKRDETRNKLWPGRKNKSWKWKQKDDNQKS